MPATALEQLQLEFVNEARLDSMWPSDQTRKVTGELVLAGDYHQFGLIHKACIRGQDTFPDEALWICGPKAFGVRKRGAPVLIDRLSG